MIDRTVLRLALLAALAGSSNISLAEDNSWSGDFGDRRFHLEHDSLLISSSTYDRTKGALASLNIGATLPNSATATASAVASNNYVTVWNNASVDGSFGATSPIALSDVDAHSGRVFHTLPIPTEAVVTSFSSKSELGLHIARDWRGPHVVFVAYAGPGVGALDVSNSDAVAGQDPTNPVTFAFGLNYAFHRTIVSMDEDGDLAYTPTINYGGNNGRSALLGPNGLYYSLGNANNGDAAAFVPSNGTNPDVTETTGLEGVRPINAHWPSVTRPVGSSAEVDSLLQFKFTAKPDKPGKDDNYRGVSEYGGALYFTKGSGSNGVDTVYSVDSLPTLENAASATINIVPGFPTDSAKATGGDFTPFAVFFANPTTMYVTDEGSGNATDAASHAGLQSADPNKVVRITDDLEATTLTAKVAEESFKTIAGPTYGKVYRGVAYVD